VRIANIEIKNFRCFSSLNLSFEKPIIVIEGLNGTGKTSLLEAIHYLCYLRSFRTHVPQELMQFGQDTFFIKARLHNDTVMNESYDLQVGLSGKRRLVKINNKAVASYKELLNYYRIVTITEDDLSLIKDGPEMRRIFIDQCITFFQPDMLPLFKKCKDIVENRNTLLKQNFSHESYALWTEQLWQISDALQKSRIEALDMLENQVLDLINTYFNNEFVISLVYKPKKELRNSLAEFLATETTLVQDEQRFGRNLFGAHQDDFTIIFKDSASRKFASRGQQKLITLLLKIAQIRCLAAQNSPAILLLDDFMTDLDTSKAGIVIQMLADLNTQLIFTVPTPHGFLHSELLQRGGQHIILTN